MCLKKTKSMEDWLVSKANVLEENKINGRLVSIEG